MTNATVEADMASNAQVVKDAADADARRILTLTYKGGTQTVIVPDDAPIVRLEPATRALVTAGAKANVAGYKAADGSLTADQRRHQRLDPADVIRTKLFARWATRFIMGRGVYRFRTYSCASASSAPAPSAAIWPDGFTRAASPRR